MGALHTSWVDACASAQRELVERDRVLRCWDGSCSKTERSADALHLARRLVPEYRARVYEFGAPSLLTTAGDPAAALRVAGVFLFPRAATAPLAYGFSAAASLRDAAAGAEREALQRLAFLWGEPLPTRAPAPTAGPDYHQDYYLYPPHHEQLLAWLDGAAPGSARLQQSERCYAGERTSFIDLTPEGSRGRLAVAKAVSCHARRLCFGLARPASCRAPHPIA